MIDRGLRDALDALYLRYNDRRFVDPDPLALIYPYDDPADREIAGMVASSLAFGGVRQIMASVGSVLEKMGESPSAFLKASDRRALARAFGGFRHRWTTGLELASMLSGIRSVLERFGSLENAFVAAGGPGDEDTLPAMTGFAGMIRESAPGDTGRLIPSPGKGSACKRLNLFLRWMVRSDAVDPGGWDSVPASKLIVPLDVHMHRFGRLLGLTSRSQGDIRTAREVTAGLRELDPSDPVRYDFPVTRLGIRRDEDRGELLARLGLECCGGRVVSARAGAGTGSKAPGQEV